MQNLGKQEMIAELKDIEKATGSPVSIIEDDQTTRIIKRMLSESRAKYRSSRSPSSANIYDSVSASQPAKYSWSTGPQKFSPDPSDIIK